MKRSIISLLFLFSACFFSANVGFGQTSIINTSRSNIKRPSAAYTPKDGLTLTIKESDLTPPEKKELAAGFFIAQANIVLTEEECKALKAPAGTTIKAGRYPITKKGDIYIVPLRPDKK